MSLASDKIIMPKSIFYKTNLFFRSSLYSILNIILIVIFFIPVLLSAPFPVRVAHFFIRIYLYLSLYLLSLICRIHCQVEGLHHIPKDRAGIIMSKHQSTWETFYLPTIFHAPAIILKKELFWVPFFGWGLAISDPIAINRNDKRSAMQQVIIQGKKRLDDGRWILVFPEGTRVAPGTIGNYRLGGARLAEKTGYPVIPVAHNAGRFWPRRKFLKLPGTIRVVIGPPIESKDRKAEEILNLTKHWIEDTMTRIDRV